MNESHQGMTIIGPILGNRKWMSLKYKPRCCAIDTSIKKTCCHQQPLWWHLSKHILFVFCAAISWVTLVRNQRLKDSIKSNSNSTIICWIFTSEFYNEKSGLNAFKAITIENIPWFESLCSCLCLSCSLFFVCAAAKFWLLCVPWLR